LKWVEIDLGAIAGNLQRTRSALKPATELMAVVKADAYGHGAVEVARLALKKGADRLGVLTVEEALALRRAGVRGTIVVLAPPSPAEAAAAVKSGAEITVDSEALANALARAAKRPVRIHLDLDFGLGRWGLAPSKALSVLDRLSRKKKIAVAGLSTHLDYLPGKNAVEAEEKLDRFERIAAAARKRHPGIVRHCANSSILLDFPHRQFDLVRVGNLLYGVNPTTRRIALKNPFAFKARLTSIRTVRKGEPIGYASEYLAPRKMRVASVQVGYADGLTMEPAERFIGFGRGFHYWGMLGAKRVPFVGRCGIAHVLVDVSQAPRAKIGDPVTLPIRRTAASARLPRLYRK
jgi:alanine racemase